jgi:hypothetical protein
MMVEVKNSGKTTYFSSHTSVIVLSNPATSDLLKGFYNPRSKLEKISEKKFQHRLVLPAEAVKAT